MFRADPARYDFYSGSGDGRKPIEMLPDLPAAPSPTTLARGRFAWAELARSELFILVAAGFAARVYVAIAQPHVIWPDEQFQTLEPANWLVNGIGGLTWEWQTGARNWIMPALHAPLLFALRQVGVVGGPVAVEACRVLAALVASVGLHRFGQLLRLRGLSPAVVGVALLPLLFAPHMIGWGAATFSETWSVALLWLGMPFAISTMEDPSSRRGAHLGIGLWLAALFGVRFAMAFWVAPLALLALWIYRRRRAAVGYAALGFVLGLLLLGLLDLVTLGKFLSSPFAYYRANVTDGMAAGLGELPWFEYFYTIARDLHFLTPVLCCLLFGSALAARRLRLGRFDALVLIPATVFFVVHSCIGHKEPRFILACYPALLYLGALGLDAWLQRWASLSRRAAGAFRRPAVLVPLAAALGTWGVLSLQYDGFYHPLGASDVTFVAYEDGMLQRHPEGCVAQVGDPYMLYGRGHMGFGLIVDFRDVDEATLASRPRELAECLYALVSPELSSKFLAAANAWGWRRLATGASGVELFARTPPPVAQGSSRNGK